MRSIYEHKKGFKHGSDDEEREFGNNWPSKSTLCKFICILSIISTSATLGYVKLPTHTQKIRRS